MYPRHAGHGRRCARVWGGGTSEESLWRSFPQPSRDVRAYLAYAALNESAEQSTRRPDPIRVLFDEPLAQSQIQHLTLTA